MAVAVVGTGRDVLLPSCCGHGRYLPDRRGRYRLALVASRAVDCIQTESRASSDSAVGAVVVGIPANLAFTALLRHRYYVPADPMADWVPFFPSSAWVLDVGSGGRFINGGTEALLWSSWFALAIPVWVVTWILHRRVLVHFGRALI